MEVKYDVKWEQLLADLSDMSEIAEEMLQMAIEALDEQDVSLARQVINRDDVLDNYQVTIEEETARLLSLNQPLKSDVWNNVAAVKIAGDLERVGDLAYDIAETVFELKNEEYLEPLVLIPELADLVSEMLDTVLNAFTSKNIDLAEAVCKKDEEADNLYEEIYKNSIKLIDRNTGTSKIHQIVSFINVAKALE
ncbi:MAG: phosphate signaling complex protein PhoU, partial [Halanaerobiaceae bacterium]